MANSKRRFATRYSLFARSLIAIEPAAAPALLPHALADGAGDARRVGGGRDDARRRLAPGDLQHQLGAHRVAHLLALADRHHECARAADHAVLVIDVELLDIDRAGLWFFQHDRQAVDGDALRHHLVA